MSLVAMYCNSGVSNEIYCEISKTGEISVPPFDELIISDYKDNIEKPYLSKMVLYKTGGGDFLILGEHKFDKDLNPNVFAKGSKDPVSVKMELPTEKKSNTGIDIEWNEIDVLIAQKPNENARDEYLVYENKIYEILKPPVKVNDPIFFRLNECGCSFSQFYEKYNLNPDFFSLT